MEEEVEGNVCCVCMKGERESESVVSLFEVGWSWGKMGLI